MSNLKAGGEKSRVVREDFIDRWHLNRALQEIKERTMDLVVKRVSCCYNFSQKCKLNLPFLLSIKAVGKFLSGFSTSYDQTATSLTKDTIYSLKKMTSNI